MSALSERYDGLAPATRILLIAHRELLGQASIVGEPHRKGRMHKARARLSMARERWVNAGCPDLDTDLPNVAALLGASKALQDAVTTFLRSPSPLAALFPGLDDMGIERAARLEAEARRSWTTPKPGLCPQPSGGAPCTSR